MRLSTSMVSSRKVRGWPCCRQHPAIIESPTEATMNPRFQARVVFFAVVATMAVIPALAGVRVVLNRPGCTIPDASVEVINMNGEKWWRVKIEGAIGNASPGPSNCSDSTACSSSFPSPETLLTLAPCPSGPHGASRCGSKNANLPTCLSCHGDSTVCPNPPYHDCPAACSYSSCDNRNTANANCSGSTCAVTCGNSSTEWCASIGDLRVTLVETSTDGINWTADGTVLCRHGSYGSSPACDISSYCTNHSAITQACANLDPDPICEYE